MAFTEAELALEAERRKFYDPLIIKQFERRHKTYLAVTAHENSDKDAQDKLTDATLFDTAFSALYGGVAVFCAESMGNDQVWGFELSTNAKACLFGAVTIATAGFLGLTTSPEEN